MDSKSFHNTTDTKTNPESDIDVFVVTRGERMDPPPRSHLFPAPVLNPRIDFVTRMLHSAQLDYSGAFHSNYFKVDKPIELLDVGFFGPCYEQQAEYFAHVELFEPKNRKQILPECNSPRIARQKCTVVAKQEEIFYVGFDRRVLLEPHTWYLIQFMLDGPCTFRCDHTRRFVQVQVRETNVSFEFNYGSMQMPSLSFRLIQS